MADPDWIGNAPERPYWADDGQSIYYSVKRPGSEARDQIQAGLDGARIRVVADADKGTVDSPDGDWSSDYSRKVYEQHADIFIKRNSSAVFYGRTRTRPDLRPA